MWTWLTEHWEFAVGTVLGLIGLVAGGISIFQQIKPKQLDYEILADIQMISPQARHLRQDLNVLYRNARLDDPRIVSLVIRNTGKREITQEDFRWGDPVTICYSDNPPIDAKVAEASEGLDPSKLATAQPIDPAAPGLVKIDTHLLNRREAFIVQLLSDGPHGDIKVTSRFAGQKRPMRRFDRNAELQGARHTALYGVVGVLVAIAAAATVSYGQPLADSRFAVYVLGAVQVVGLISLLFTFFALSRMAYHGGSFSPMN